MDFTSWTVDAALACSTSVWLAGWQAGVVRQQARLSLLDCYWRSWAVARLLPGCPASQAKTGVLLPMDAPHCMSYRPSTAPYLCRR